MDGHTLLRWIEPILGIPLMLVVLADVFLTVLYARMGTAILSERLGRALWVGFRAGPKGGAPRPPNRVLAHPPPGLVLPPLAGGVRGPVFGAGRGVPPPPGAAPGR